MNGLVYLLVFILVSKCSHGLDENCKTNSDCATINALCINDKCSCDALSYYNDTQCLQYATEYGGICYDSKQCEWLGDNSVCRNNRCGCSTNFRWYRGKCQKYIDKGQKCSEDECYNGYDLLSLTCSSEGICECSSSYYDRGYDCRDSSAKSGDCAIDLDCRSSSEELQCNLGKCDVKGSAVSKHFIDLFEETELPVKILTYEEDSISCEIDDDCKNMAHSLCNISIKTCGCKEDTHYLHNGNCVQGLSYCDSDNECVDTNNTMCFKNTCVCQRGFFLRQKQCIAELGMEDAETNYKDDSDCPIKPGKLIDSICYCKAYWFNDDSNRQCIKTAIQSTNSCLTNEWCSAMGPYSFCNSTTSTCQCSSIAKFNDTTYYCDRESEDVVTDGCLRDMDCNINQRCLDERCECIDNFFRNDDNICVPNIGASCELNSCSHIENSYCVQEICKCGTGYIGKETKCLKVADYLEAPCEEQAQCDNIPHAVCGESEVEYSTPEYHDSLRCVCDDGYTDVYGICRQTKKYGDPCMTEEDCTLVLNRSYKCRNSICQCGVGESLKNGYCTSAGNVTLISYFLMLVVLVVKVFVK